MMARLFFNIWRHSQNFPIIIKVLPNYAKTLAQCLNNTQNIANDFKSVAKVANVVALIMTAYRHHGVGVVDLSVSV